MNCPKMPDRLEQLTKLHIADPVDPFVTYGIALEHGKQQRYEQAIQWLNKTLELDPNYCYAFFQKAKMSSELGDDAAARKILEQGIATAEQIGDEHAQSELAELLTSLDNA